MGKKRPKAPDSEGKGTEKTRTKQGEVLPKDKRALEALITPQSLMRGAVLASSSTTPWQRRVRLRTALASCGGEEDMAEASEFPTRPSCLQGGGAPTLHGWQQQSGVPRSLLQAMPKTLGFDGVPAVPVELSFNG